MSRRPPAPAALRFADLVARACALLPLRERGRSALGAVTRKPRGVSARAEARP